VVQVIRLLEHCRLHYQQLSNKNENMRIFKILTIVLAGTLLTTSCNDWFDVTSSNEIREKDHYSKDSGFKQSLIGCYIKIGEEDLYGKNLSWYMPDLLANETRKYIAYGSNATSYELQAHNYSTTNTKSVIEGIWASAYSVIVNANEALKNIDERKDAINDVNYHVIKGELLAVRAFMHFQLLRLYGYGDWANRKNELDNKKTIPYVTTVDKNITEQATGAQVISYLIKDLTDAADLLKDYDPACGKHDASFYEEVNDDGFYTARNTRLNYYAVEALLAQVYLWDGSEANKQLALPICNELIEKLSDGVNIQLRSDNTFLVNFATPATLNRSNASLINESLFAIDVNKLDQKMADFINPSYYATDYNSIYLSPEQMKNIYDDASTDEDESTVDVRATVLSSQNLTTSDMGYVPVKLYQKNLTNSYYAGRVPVIRLPEIYYMAAECYASQGDARKAMELLNVVREKRGLYTPLTDLTAEQVQEEIKKEYRKEFLGEGEIFYYYKRMGVQSIQNFEEMTDADYLLPYPDMETSAGRVQ